jgi:ankyrin repeat protein
MLKRCAAVAILTLCSLAGTLSAQTQKVEFVRDVLPILRENCHGCHGPAQQMNNFRLDRRSNVLRGGNGNRNDVVPGSSESSRMYLRLIGRKQFGNPMPPAGPLSPEKIEILKAWIDQGLDWPDEYANEDDLPPADVRAVRMIDALRAGDNATFQKLVAGNPQALNLRGPEGTTPFMASILYSDAATVAQLLEKGADPNKCNDAGATALMWAALNLEKARLLLDHGADASVRSKDGNTAIQITTTQPGTTPIVKLFVQHGVKADAGMMRDAIASGDAELVQFLLDQGVPAGGAIAAALDSECAKCVEVASKNLDARAATQALLTLSVGARPANIKFVLDRGANPNVADGEGRSALMNIANSDRMPLESVRMMIEHGADVNAKNNADQTVLDMAKLHGDSPIVDLLVKAGAKAAAPGPKTVTPLKTNTIEAAVRRSIPMIQKADVVFMTKSGCTSCHNQGTTQMAVGAARKMGFKVDEAMAAKQIEAVQKNFDGWKDRLLQGSAPGGVAYTLVSLHAMGYKPDLITDAIARDIRMHQKASGKWQPGCGGARPPTCGFEISNTALSLRALQLFGLKQDRADYDRAIQRAGDWLAKATPEVTEDRAFRLLGLVWAGKDKATIQKAIKAILDTQRPDGGWSDVPTLPSGAYATGPSLVALHEAGVPVSDPAYQRGVKFLLSTQLEDGSWYQKTRSLPVQPYFDVGFPHGFDQWVSVAGTSWATMALAYASEGKHSTSAAEKR